MDKQAILNGCYFSLDEESGVKFRLDYRNWNDFGYHTLYSLEMSLPNTSYPYRIADIRVMNIGQKTGDKPLWAQTAPIVFIANLDSAERLFLLLTPNQRQRLEDILLLRYDGRHITNEHVFIQSVTRGYTISEFNDIQVKIKEFMHSTIDVRTILDHHKTQLYLFLSEIQD